MIELTTPYRVFYLVNNGTCNTPKFEFLWNLEVENHGTEEQVNHYTRLAATQKDNFKTVTVSSCRVAKHLCSMEKTITDEKSMSWDSLDDETVRMMDDYYKNKNSGAYERQIKYADKIQKLVESPDSLSLSFDSDGMPVVNVRGLPYLYTGGRKGDLGVSIKSGFSSTYSFDIDTGFDSDYDKISFDIHQLINAMRQSKYYEEARDAISKIFGFDYDYDFDN